MFSFYNTATQQHELLQSEPLFVQVKQGRITTAMPLEVPTQQLDEDSHDQCEDEQYFDDEVVQIRGSAGGLGAGILLLMMIIPFLYLGRRRLKEGVLMLSEHLGLSSQEKRDAAILNKIIATQDVAELHRFFVTLLTRLAGTEASIDGTFAQQQARRWGWDHTKQESFTAFIEGCGQAAFAPQLMLDSEKKALIARAHYWYTLVVQESKA